LKFFRKERRYHLLYIIFIIKKYLVTRMMWYWFNDQNRYLKCMYKILSLPTHYTDFYIWLKKEKNVHSWQLWSKTCSRRWEWLLKSIRFHIQFFLFYCTTLILTPHLKEKKRLMAIVVKLDIIYRQDKCLKLINVKGKTLEMS